MNRIVHRMLALLSVPSELGMRASMGYQGNERVVETVAVGRCLSTQPYWRTVLQMLLLLLVEGVGPLRVGSLVGR